MQAYSNMISIDSIEDILHPNAQYLILDAINKKYSFIIFSSVKREELYDFHSKMQNLSPTSVFEVSSIYSICSMANIHMYKPKILTDLPVFANSNSIINFISNRVTRSSLQSVMGILKASIPSILENVPDMITVRGVCYDENEVSIDTIHDLLAMYNDIDLNINIDHITDKIYHIKRNFNAESFNLYPKDYDIFETTIRHAMIEYTSHIEMTHDLDSIDEPYMHHRYITQNTEDSAVQSLLNMCNDTMVSHLPSLLLDTLINSTPSVYESADWVTFRHDYINGMRSIAEHLPNVSDIKKYQLLVSAINTHDYVCRVIELMGSLYALFLISHINVRENQTILYAEVLMEEMSNIWKVRDNIDKFPYRCLLSTVIRS